MRKLEKNFPPSMGPFTEMLSRSESGEAPKPLSINLVDLQASLPREILCGGGYRLKCVGCGEHVMLDERVYSIAKARLAEAIGMTHVACSSCGGHQLVSDSVFVR